MSEPQGTDRTAGDDFVPIHPAREVPPWAHTMWRRRNRSLQGHATADLGWEFACRLIEDRGLDHNRELLQLAFDLRCVLDVVTDVQWNRFSRTCARHAMGPLMPLFARLRAAGAPGREIVFADLGCGSWNPYAVSFLALAAGADRALAFDLDLPQNDARAVKVVAELVAAALVDPPAVFGEDAPTAAEILARLDGFDLSRLARADTGCFPHPRLRFDRRDARSLGLRDGEVDLLRSTAFLEHVAEPDAVMAEFARVTRPGGIGWHHIDAVDHRSYDGSGTSGLEYLGHPEPGDYVRIPREGGRLFEQNRVRPHEWVQRFERHGFRVESFQPLRPVQVDEGMRSGFVEPYRSMPLTELTFTAGDYLVLRV